MEKWQHCLDYYFNEEASDLRVAPFSASRIKSGENWSSPFLEEWSAEECDELCLKLLSEEQKHQLATDREVFFRLSTKQRDLRGHVCVSSDGFVFRFRKLPKNIPTAEELTIPRAVIDLFQAPQGLILLTGGVATGKTTTLSAVIGHELEREFRETLLVENIREIANPVTRVQLGGEITQEQLRGYAARVASEWVCFDSGYRREVVEAAMNAAFNGRLAVLVLPFASVALAIKAIRKDLLSWGNSFYSDSLHEVFRGAVGQILVPSKDNGRIPCHEICAATESVRAVIRDQKFDDLEETMSTSTESSGMRSLNQTLLHLVLRRKVDIKKAFQLSRNPSELDQLLNKAGI